MDHRSEQADLHEIAQLVLARVRISRHQVAHRIVLLLQAVDAGDSGQPAEVLFADDANLMRLMRIQLFSAPELVALLMRLDVRSPRQRTETGRTHDKHRGLGVDVVAASPSEPAHERLRLSPPQPTDFSRPTAAPA